MWATSGHMLSCYTRNWDEVIVYDTMAIDTLTYVEADDGGDEDDRLVSTWVEENKGAIALPGQTRRPNKETSSCSILPRHVPKSRPPN